MMTGQREDDDALVANASAIGSAVGFRLRFR
jgi:hypothetical protein